MKQYRHNDMTLKKFAYFLVVVAAFVGSISMSLLVYEVWRIHG